MSDVVQATCPGCKRVLRIPVDWLKAVFRCKYCGIVVKVRSKEADPKTSAVSPKPGTASSPIPTAVPAKPVASRPVVDVPGIVSSPPSPASAASSPNQDAIANEAPFAHLDVHSGPSEIVRSRHHRRRSSSSRWVGVLAGLLLIGVTVAASVIVWPYIAQAMRESATKKDLSGSGIADQGTTPNTRIKQDKNDSSKNKTPSDVPRGDRPFPRRALVISVNNYYYANPVHYGIALSGARNVHTLIDRMIGGFHILYTQMGELSDSAIKNPYTPLKPVIQNTITEFLNSSRKQDRILLMFIGHIVEIGGVGYLVPIEGELDRAETLIPLRWLYDSLAACKACQKVLIVDTCRFNPVRGFERTASGPMSAKLDALLKSPPSGVQVWTACVAGQYSYEFDDGETNNGLFVDELYEIFAHKPSELIQNPTDALPLARLVEAVNQRLQAKLSPLQNTQVSRLSGQEPPKEAGYDPEEPVPPTPRVASPPPPAGGLANRKLIEGIFKDIDTPTLRATHNPSLGDSALRFAAGMQFSAEAVKSYQDDGKNSKFRSAVQDTRKILERELRGKRLREDWKAPADEGKFREMVLKYQKEHLASAIGTLDQAITDLKDAGKDRDQASKRWQANYDYILARLQMQLAYIYEYSSLLGGMRKGLPPRDPKVHTGWRMASRTTLQGNRIGKKLAKEGDSLLAGIIKDHPNTPWAVLAKRDRLTALGLEWQPTR